MLCESGWNGGAGYSLQTVAEMTPDQIYFRLCDIKLLKRDSDGRRVQQVHPNFAKDGRMKVRLADGTLSEVNPNGN